MARSVTRQNRSFNRYLAHRDKPQTFGNPGIKIAVPKKAGSPIEVYVGDQFMGVLHRDEEDGEVSYSLHITILEEDLPKAAKG